MKFLRSIFTTVIIAIVSIALSAGCSSKTGSASQPTQAIAKLRNALVLPVLPLTFIETTTDPNSPNVGGIGLEVVKYRDSEGRIYSVDKKSNHVVEVDARALLSQKSSDKSSLSSVDIKAQAMKFAKIVIPDFDTLQSSLQYEEGGKQDNYFFTWYGEISPGATNRPRLQFGFYKNGFLFAYYNTLSIEK